jgi:signal peptidase
VRSIYEETAEGRERVPVPAEAKPVAPKPRWRRWTGWVATALLVTLGVLFFTGAFGLRMVVVDGISMEPTYSRGDMAIVRHVDVASLAVNDVIVFLQGGRPVIHRIVAIDQGPEGLVLTTQGDNVDNPDPPVGAGQIEGKVVFLIPGVGYVNLLLRGR